jgi:hypothetical protein
MRAYLKILALLVPREHKVEASNTGRYATRSRGGGRSPKGLRLVAKAASS